jgi:diguanylate cyclase (GGDEF)-like protein/PAS domain S-box-containing protein
MKPENTLLSGPPGTAAADLRQADASTDLLRQVDSVVQLLNIRHEAIVCLDERWHVAVFNQGAEKIFGYRREEVLGAPFARLVCRYFQVREKRRLRALTRIARENRIGFKTDSIICQRKNGERFPTDISLSQGVSPGQRLYTLLIHDTTDRVQQAERLAYQAGHDQLTDLPNRALLDERLRAGIARADRFGRKLGVIYMDLDQFKPVNDRYGHETGDRLLQAVARRLGETMRRSDTISRIGGDEFIVCVEQLKQVQDALGAARKIAGSLAAPFQVLGHELQVSASIGIAVYPDDASQAETLLRLADQAMYRARAEGRGPALHQSCRD